MKISDLELAVKPIIISDSAVVIIVRNKQCLKSKLCGINGN